jgi:outer membrane lipoprotein-sorting protein
MGVGIGADYVIYLLFRLREEHAGNGSPADAMRRTLVTAGSAIVFVAGAVAAGYSVLLLSTGFWNHIWMGILISTAMITSAAAAVTVVPVLVIWWRPAFIYRGTKAPISAASPAAIVVALCGTLFYSGTRAADLPTAEQVMQQNFLVDKVVGSRSKVTNILRNKEGQERVRESTSITKLEDNGADTQRIVRFYAPADVNGTSILLIEHSKSDDDIWIYLPALKKVRRLVASNKRDSFAGTDFSYGDVIGYAVDDWRHTLVGEDTLNGEPCFLVESVPASQIVKETSGYSKRRNCISKSRYTTLRTEVWDTEGQLLKEEAYSDFQNVDPAHGRWVAMRSTARNVQTGHTTEVIFKDYSIDPSVSAALFTTRTLEFGS